MPTGAPCRDCTRAGKSGRVPGYMVLTSYRSASKEWLCFFPEALHWDGQDRDKLALTFTCEKCGCGYRAKDILIDSPDPQVFGMKKMLALEYKRVGKPTRKVGGEDESPSD